MVPFSHFHAHLISCCSSCDLILSYRVDCTFIPCTISHAHVARLPFLAAAAELRSIDSFALLRSLPSLLVCLRVSVYAASVLLVSCVRCVSHLKLPPRLPHSLSLSLRHTLRADAAAAAAFAVERKESESVQQQEPRQRFQSVLSGYSGGILAKFTVHREIPEA